uniref:BZIP domain-containing protein n=1 Tax=Lactuca sativa TaxID=4236 RepID=A0A9R1XY13_LACSA|nr:hypothetical protein LSAT_V11C100023550 [Lactuca sativa]
MEGMASIALLLDGSISGHFVQLPESVYYQMGQSHLFVSTSYLSVKQATTSYQKWRWKPKDCNLPNMDDDDGDGEPESEESQNGNNMHGCQNGGPNHSMAIVPISGPGSVVGGPSTGTNLNIGMEQIQIKIHPTLSYSYSCNSWKGNLCSSFRGNACCCWLKGNHSATDLATGLDERELKRQRRKQSNRESARRSRLHKQSFQIPVSILGIFFKNMNILEGILSIMIVNLKKLTPRHWFSDTRVGFGCSCQGSQSCNGNLRIQGRKSRFSHQKSISCVSGSPNDDQIQGHIRLVSKYALRRIR